MNRPNESDYISNVAYCRDLELYCDEALRQVAVLRDALEEAIYYRDDGGSRTRDGRTFCSVCESEQGFPHMATCVLSSIPPPGVLCESEPECLAVSCDECHERAACSAEETLYRKKGEGK